MKFLVIILLLSNCAHSSLPFQIDLAYKSSGEAGSYEQAVLLNGKVCKDLDGRPGSCILTLKKSLSLSVSLLPRSYAFGLFLSCNNGISFKKDIEANKAFSVTISPDRWANVEEVNCIGVVSPLDRPEPITSKFRFIVELISIDYSYREEIYLEDGKINLGHFALYSQLLVLPQNKHIQLSKQTVIDWPKGATNVFAESESYKARFNTAWLP